MWKFVFIERAVYDRMMPLTEKGMENGKRKIDILGIPVDDVTLGDALSVSRTSWAAAGWL